MARRQGQLRLVGGVWRSRRLRVPTGPDLRPTPDRVRETLFNWLGSWIEGKRVLDLFAGSGALGLEALSRGAAEAVFVDSSRRAVRALEDNIALLGTTAATVLCMDAMRYLTRGREAFDLVFVDPPYATGLASRALEQLANGPARVLLAPAARIYVECGVRKTGSGRNGTLPLPPGWRKLREIRAGEVHGYLLAEDIHE
jgi:16S rRNA (guanine966-N2)-methyltransferase